MKQTKQNQSLTATDPVRPDPERSKNASGLYRDRCQVCNRNNILLRKYGFGEPEEIIDFKSDPPVRPNPRAMTVEVCGTDLILLSRLKRELPKHSPKQLLDLARKYREAKPIKESSKAKRSKLELIKSRMNDWIKDGG